MPCAHSRASIQSSMVITEKVLIMVPVASARSNPSAPCSLSTFGIGQGARYASSRATARGDSTATPIPASPPSAFWNEKVVTSSLGQFSGMANAAEVASQMLSPSRSSLMKSAFGTRTPEVVPFHGNTTSFAGSTRDRSGSAPHGASMISGSSFR